MKKYLLFFLLVISFRTFSQDGTYDFARKNYSKAIKDSALCSNLVKRLKNAPPSDATLSCYRGAATAAMANHVKDKSEKLKLFKEGKGLIEQAIAADKENPELRLLRMSIQENCPKILGYNKEIGTDRDFIIAKLSSVKSQTAKKMIVDYLMQSPSMTAEEKKKLK
ncbi:MAG: hypothetical protein ACJ77K_04765 [Bacteroidia bacterium]